MHGEYKVAGGKLVVVDLDVVDGVFENVKLSGDFFLEPDSALATITAAIHGLPAEASGRAIAQAVREAAGEGVHFIGFSPEAIGIAVRRAVGMASSWGDYTFDIIHSTPRHPAMHLALDEVIPEEVAAGRRNPTLVIWEWDTPIVDIGSFQSYVNEIDPQGREKYDMLVVRRISGGGAMLMDPGNSITYSLIVPSTLVDGLSFEQSYAFLDDWVIEALADVGVEAQLIPLNDIGSKVGKIGGSAQKRFASGITLHHATLAYDIDADKMVEILRIGREKLADKGTRSANKRVDPMRSQTGMSRAQIIESFKETFKRRYRTADSEFTQCELDRASQLVESKFLTDAWTHRVP